MRVLVVKVDAEILAGQGNKAGWQTMPAELRFSPQDPIAACLRFGGAEVEEPVDWHFAFDLLHRVSVGWSTVGYGDVRFSTDPLSQQFVLLRLASPSGQAVLRILIADIKRFVLEVKPLLDAEPESDAVQLALDQAIYDILEDAE